MNTDREGGGKVSSIFVYFPLPLTSLGRYTATKKMPDYVSRATTTDRNDRAE